MWSFLCALPLELYYPATKLLRCDIKANECKVVADGFTGANGITISSKRDELWLNDCPESTLHNYKVSKDGSIEYKEKIELPFVADNVEYDSATGKLFLGCIPEPFKTFMHMEDHT